MAVGQIPVYYNHFNTGRPSPTDDAGNWYSRYRDVKNDPLYPFGFGLSYSKFTYGALAVAKSVEKNTLKLTATVEVKNTSGIDGEEIVQLYIRDYTASIVRPVKELKAFERVKLQAGERKEIVFTLGKKDLSFFDADGNAVFEAGKFGIFVGGSSADVQLVNVQLK